MEVDTVVPIEGGISAGSLPCCIRAVKSPVKKERTEHGTRLLGYLLPHEEDRIKAGVRHEN